MVTYNTCVCLIKGVPFTFFSVGSTMVWQTCLGFDCHGYMDAINISGGITLTDKVFWSGVNWNHTSYFIRPSERLPVCGQTDGMFYSCPLNICLSGCQKSSGSRRTPGWLAVNELQSGDWKQPVRALHHWATLQYHIRGELMCQRRVIRVTLWTATRLISAS